MPQALLLGIGLDQGDPLGRTAGEPQIGQRFRVDREDRTGGAELRAHVADRGPVRDRHRGDAVAVELHELADHAVLAEQFGDGEDQIGGGGAVGQLTRQPEPHHLRDEHADRLAEHGRLGLDAADAPPQHAQAVLHGGVRIGAHAGVGVGGTLARHDHPRQVLDVHLVNDARPRRHHLELTERLLAPAQEREPLPVALELEIDVAVERVRTAEDVGDDRVVDDQLGRDQRVDPGRVTTDPLHGLAHRGEVHHRRHPGQVLEDHPRRRERDLGIRLGLRVPLSEGGHVLRGDVASVLVPEQVLQQNFQAERQVTDAGDGIQPVNRVVRIPDPQ